MNKAKTIEIIAPKSIWTGDAKAPVSLVMYGDYESEPCAKANDVVNKLLVQFDGLVKFNFRHFPLTKVYQHSHKAAEAAVGAAQEGKFWPMHNLLFSNRRHLGTTSLKGYAKEAGVTNKKFLSELVDCTYGWTVRNDLLEGLSKGVRDVPSVYINDVLFTGHLTVPGLGKAIDEVLSDSKKKKAVKQRA
jgi:protein-disulfide isomerase